MLHKHPKLFAMAGFITLAFAATNAHAQLSYLGTQDFGGAGLGAMNTVLTIQNNGTETGSVGLDAGGTQVITGDAKTGASQTLVRSLSGLGINAASNLRVVFNANEPAANGIDLSNLVLSIFNPSGALLFQSGAFNAVSFADTFNGTGNGGFVFGLDSEQSALAQSAAFTGDFGMNLVGLSATASQAAGGSETFFITNAVSTSPVPEPSTYGMVFLGLMGLTWLRRKNLV